MTSPYQTLVDRLPELEARLDHHFENKELILQAFCHRSFTNENPRCPVGHNERLEFLGDAVLGLIAADYVYRELPDHPEGDLTHLRARLVEGSSCFLFLQELNISEFLLLGRGEQRSDGRSRNSIWSDLFEAIIAAIFLDSDFQTTLDWFHRLFITRMELVLEKPVRNWKADLQDYSQKATGSPPLYEIKTEQGPDHEKHYEIVVRVDGEILAAGEGKSKKEAQQAAAENALLKIEGTEDE
jgi:ribonuclease-3